MIQVNSGTHSSGTEVLEITWKNCVRCNSDSSRPAAALAPAGAVLEPGREEMGSAAAPALSEVQGGTAARHFKGAPGPSPAAAFSAAIRHEGRQRSGNAGPCPPRPRQPLCAPTASPAGSSPVFLLELFSPSP